MFGEFRVKSLDVNSALAASPTLPGTVSFNSNFSLAEFTRQECFRTQEQLLSCLAPRMHRSHWRKTAMSFALYIVGYVILIIGLALGAYYLHLPPHWVGV